MKRIEVVMAVTDDVSDAAVWKAMRLIPGCRMVIRLTSSTFDAQEALMEQTAVDIEKMEQHVQQGLNAHHVVSNVLKAAILAKKAQDETN